MPGTSRPSRSSAFVALAAAALLACSTSAPPPMTCASASECPSDARCVSATCVANAPPSARVALPPSPETNVLLSFDASASADPDTGDSVAAFAWTFRALDDQCSPPAVAGAGPVANVRFACAGRYAVDVIATDQLGATSTATAEFVVAARAGPALVEVGSDVVVGHLCDATPTCRPSAPVSLAASTPGISPAGVSFTWSVQPPADRPLAPYRRVSFSPDASAAAPTVTIETDGEAISGDWIFRVEARDSAGVIGTAIVTVNVGNRPPVVTKTIPVPDHAFDGSFFTASGAVSFSVSDPDGDPLVDRTIEPHHTGDGGSTFSAMFEDAPPRATFSISVPFGAPSDAAKLIGGDGLERSIVFGISDVNGARTTETWPIVVGNRPPQLADAPAPFTVDHTYDPVAQAYVADVPLSTWTDPDGDPIFQVPGSSTGDPDCPTFDVASVARARCLLAFAGTPAVGNFAGTHTVTQVVQDPWAVAAAPSAVTFTIANRPPTNGTFLYERSSCGEADVCCRTAEGICQARWSTWSGVAKVPSRWSDPDGDPLSVEVGASGSYAPVQPLVCVPSECVLDVVVSPVTYCMQTPMTYLATTVTDGAASASGSLGMQLKCP